MLGRLADQSAGFWVRTRDESTVRIVLSKSKTLENLITSKDQRSLADKDYTALMNVENLEPETIYYYDVLVDGKSSLGPDFPSFKTYPQSGTKATFSIGFGGGAGYVPPNERIWDVILSHQPSAFLFMGDNVYINMP